MHTQRKQNIKTALSNSKRANSHIVRSHCKRPIRCIQIKQRIKEDGNSIYLIELSIEIWKSSALAAYYTFQRKHSIKTERAYHAHILVLVHRETYSFSLKEST